MERLIQLLALALIRKGMDAAIAWATADEAVRGAEAPVGSCGRTRACELDDCRSYSRLDLEDDCYAWDEPKSRRYN